MNTYERPMVLLNDEISEGIYTSSGLPGDNGSGGGTSVCESIYMNGTYKASDWSNWATGTFADLGCHGCPANWSDGVCHASGYPESEVLKPSWEVQGKSIGDRWNQ